MMRGLLLWLVWSCSLVAIAQDMKTVFVAMPDSLTPLLTKVNKEDCIDFLASKMKAEVKNRFDQTAEMKELTDDYLQMMLTEKSSLEMKLLPINDSTKVVCLVKTVCASACDSEVRFYAPDWSQEFAKDDFLTCPDIEAFYLPQDSITEEYALIRKTADMNLLRVSLSKEDASLTYLYTTPESMNKEDKEKLLPYLRKEPIVLQWQDGMFR